MNYADARDRRTSIRIPSASWVALALLLATYTVSWIDRYVFAILLDPIRIDLGLKDWQIGLLTGFAFTIAYSLAGFPFARWSDRGNRSRLISIALAGWSLATMACGAVASFSGLAAARSSVAICEAGCSPAAHSLISDHFPPKRRALAFAIYGLGIPFGIWLGLALGGLVSRAYGWRTTFLLLGVPGLALALIVRRSLREPTRDTYENPLDDIQQGYSWREGLVLLGQRRAFLAMSLGLACLSFDGSGVQIWAPTYLLRADGSDIGTIGVFTGTVNGIAGLAGTLLAGFAADRFAGRDPRWFLWIAIASAGFIAVTQTMFLFLSGMPSTIFYALTMFGVSTYTAPLFAAAQMLLPSRLRAFGAATMLFLLNLIGPGAGPAAIGALSSWFESHGYDDALGLAMATSAIGLVPACALLGYAARHFPRVLHQANTV